MTQNNTRGILAMTAAMALFIVSDISIKLASASVPPAQMLVMRGMLLLPVILAVALHTRALHSFRAALRTRPLLRMAGEGSGTLIYLQALAHIPLATSLAINMVTPLLVLPLAMWLLGERIGLRQLLAVFGGLAGVLLILRPSFDGVDFWLSVSLGSAFIFAARDTLTRTIPANVPSILILLGGVVASTLAGALGMGLSEWQPVDARIAGYVAASATFVGVAMLLLIQAMRIGEVVVVSPFRYTAVLCAVVAGWIVWGDLPDGPTLAGIGLIVVAGLYALLGERLSARARARQATD
jgi:drug/metabolite transporter (DMT)-like permease